MLGASPTVSHWLMLECVREGPNFSNINQSIPTNQNTPFIDQSAIPLNYHFRQQGVINKMKPKEFDGDISKALEWFKHYSIVANNNGWDNDQKVRSLAGVMVGPAADWYNITFDNQPKDISQWAYCSFTLPTWTEFAEKFLEEYNPDGIELFLEQKLEGVFKAKNESYVEFGRRIIALINRCNPSISTNRRMLYIRKGLINDQIILLLNSVNKIEDVFDLFKKFDTNSIAVPENNEEINRNSIDEESKNVFNNIQPNQSLKYQSNSTTFPKKGPDKSNYMC